MSGKEDLEAKIRQVISDFIEEYSDSDLDAVDIVAAGYGKIHEAECKDAGVDMIDVDVNIHFNDGLSLSYEPALEQRQFMVEKDIRFFNVPESNQADLIN